VHTGPTHPGLLVAGGEVGISEVDEALARAPEAILSVGTIRHRGTPRMQIQGVHPDAIVRGLLLEVSEVPRMIWQPQVNGYCSLSEHLYCWLPTVSHSYSTSLRLDGACREVITAVLEA
jgi:hypothetical protein